MLRFLVPATVLVLLLAVPAGFAASTSLVHLGDWEDRYVLYLEAQSSTSGPFLSVDANAGAATSYTGVALASGATHGSSAASGARGPAIEFRLPTPVEKTRWLNLSKPIVGALYFQSQASAAASRDGFTVYVELWVAEKLAGGDTLLFSASTASQPWLPMYLKFRPETNVIRAGDAVVLKVYRLGGVTDFLIGTSGAQQSYIELRTFDTDPLGSSLYREGQRLYAAPSATSSGLLLAPFALAALPGAGPRRRAAQVAALIGVAAFAGCLGGDGSDASSADDDGQAKPTAVVNQTDDEGLKEAGIGALEGFVLDGDNVGLPVRGAHVALLQTNNFATTDNKGHFRFDALASDTYRLRVDANGFISYEDLVDVEVGKRTWVNVSLVRPGTGTGDDKKAHLHDLWGDLTSKVVLSTPVLLRSYPYSPPAASNTWAAYGIIATETPVPIASDVLVLPGTSVAEIVLDWSATGLAPKELQVRIVTSSNKSLDQWFVPRGPKVPIRVAMFPNEADSGHQTGTDWQVFIRLPPIHNAGQPVGPAAYAGGLVQVTMTIHKGVVPFEPLHRAFWNGADLLTLVPPTDRIASNVCCTPPYYPGAAGWVPPKGAFVPPGSKEIKGSLVVSIQGQGSPYPWKLAYRSADMGAGTWKNVPLTSTAAGTYTFTLPVGATQTDQYYQSASRWVFAVDDDMPQDARNTLVVNHGTQGKFTFQAIVYRDPSYVEA